MDFLQSKVYSNALIRMKFTRIYILEFYENNHGTFRDLNSWTLRVLSTTKDYI